MPTRSVLEIKQLFEKICPEPTLRLRCLSLFAERIKHAHRYAPDEWVVVALSNHRAVWLTVGNLVTFEVRRQRRWKRERLWMALDLKELQATPQSEMLLNDTPSWQWKTGDYSEYKRVKSRNGYYFPNADLSEKLLPVIWKLNSAFVKRIGELKHKLRSPSRDAYQPAVLAFLRQELKQPIPEPGSDFALPEEISETGVCYYEGTRKQISVNAYERNQAARNRCLEHYGFRCAVCEQCTSEIYGTVAEKLIHVHHLKPLSEIQEGYEVDAIADLRPVCPNCHAVIHRRKPPYTIEEVKDFLEKARRARRN